MNHKKKKKQKTRRRRNNNRIKQLIDPTKPTTTSTTTSLNPHRGREREMGQNNSFNRNIGGNTISIERLQVHCHQSITTRSLFFGGRADGVHERVPDRISLSPATGREEARARRGYRDLLECRLNWRLLAARERERERASEMRMF